jgi:hypothetical protein
VDVREDVTLPLVNDATVTADPVAYPTPSS